jgi:hypothetical protein
MPSNGRIKSENKINTSPINSCQQLSLIKLMLIIRTVWFSDRELFLLGALVINSNTQEACQIAALCSCSYKDVKTRLPDYGSTLVVQSGDSEMGVNTRLFGAG